MKYSEFKVEVEKMGFVVEDEGTPIYVDKSKNGETLVSIGKHKRFWLDPGWSGFNNLTEDQQLKLYDLAYQLVKTPLAEREEEKRYRLRLVANLGFRDDQRFLNLNIEREEYFICSARQSEWVKTIFTESEISKMDITGFKEDEVVG
jgi:hypothetical protein